LKTEWGLQKYGTPIFYKMPLVHGGYLDCGPLNGLPACRFAWSYEVVEPQPSKPAKPAPRELLESEEIWNAVQEYYKWKGEGIPPSDAKACLVAIRAEKEALKHPQPAVAMEVVPVTELPVRPEYGTAAFWKWCRETKAEREKAKAEKEAEKEAKAKAREDAKLAKAKAALEAKEAKAQAKALKSKK
jgi:hypothetical protein